MIYRVWWWKGGRLHLDDCGKDVSEAIIALCFHYELTHRPWLEAIREIETDG